MTNGGRMISIAELIQRADDGDSAAKADLLKALIRLGTLPTVSFYEVEDSCAACVFEWVDDWLSHVCLHPNEDGVTISHSEIPEQCPIRQSATILVCSVRDDAH